MARIYFILILLWFTVSFARSIFNIVKGIHELPHEFSSSSYEKRVGIFGAEYEKFSQLQETTNENSRILIIATHDMVARGLLYKSYYFLYPRKIEIALRNYQKNNSLYDHVIDFR